MMENSNYHAIGVMSGTSLDGLDVAWCSFNFTGKEWEYNILKATTFRYEDTFKNKLREIHDAGAEELAMFYVEYGLWTGQKINEFIQKHAIEKVDLVATHGHTVFHQPEKKFTLQIGDGNAIAAATGLMVVYDFRSLDIALGGQGAPLVPIGDELLFSQYTYCLNLGGFANISFKEKNKRIAFDICPVNTILNFLANKKGKEYDTNGDEARSGLVIENILTALNNLAFYKQPYPKSLGREWLENEFLPLISDADYPVNDLLRTACEHIAEQIAAVLNKTGNGGSVLVTGGGSFNTFLIERIKSKTQAKIIIPDDGLINYKEALIFAFLGVLRMENQINVLSDVTGASTDSCSGVVVLGTGFKKN